MQPVFLPKTIICRPGAIAEIPAVAGSGHTIILAAAASAVNSGRSTMIMNLLESAGNKVVIHIMPSGEPELETVQELAEKIHSFAADMAVAIGGGSTIDACKCACIVPAGGYIKDNFYGGKAVTVPGIPMIAVPTTFGTGSEVTSNGVLSDSVNKVKQSVRGPVMLPMAAIVDCQCGVSAPAAVKAASGMDALVQAIEASVSRNADNFSTPLARKAAEMLFDNLDKWVQYGDESAGTAVAEASLLTGIAFAHSGLGAVHGLAHPLGVRFHIPHGKACALLMPYVMTANASRMPGLYWDIPGCRERFEALKYKFFGKYSLTTCGVTRDVLPEIVRDSRSGSMRCNPVEFSDGELLHILENAL